MKTCIKRTNTKVKMRKYVIIKVQETNFGLNMNYTHHVQTNLDDVNLIGNDIRAVERNIDVLTIIFKDIGLVVNIGNGSYELWQISI